jgi:hypothetical protein
MTLVIILSWCYSSALEGKGKEKSTRAARCCRNFSVSIRDDTIYVTIDKTGRKVLP